MAHHMLAIYDKPAEASLAVDRLVANGVAQAAISLVVSEGSRSQFLGVVGGTKGAEGAATGATVGGVLGAVAAGLLATGTVVATGGAGLVLVGPVVAALAGAGAGGATGGVLGGLIGLGVPDNHVKSYEKAVGNSSMLLGVEINETNKAEVHEILKSTGGKSISTE
jgi:hypothetical protein